jgi:hypothetical protein
VLAAVRKGVSDQAGLIAETGLSKLEVRQALKGLRSAGMIPEASAEATALEAARRQEKRLADRAADTRPAAVDAVLGRIGLGDAPPPAPQPVQQESVQDLPLQDPPVQNAPASSDTILAGVDESILIFVSARADGRFDVHGPLGSHIASPSVGRLIAKLADGSLYGAAAMAAAAGVQPLEVASLQSAVRLVCNKVGRTLSVVQGIGWRIVR